MPPQTNDRLQGTLDLLVLKTLASGPMHGLERRAAHPGGVARRPAHQPGIALPGLHRLEDNGYVSAGWGTSDTNRRAKYYRLTARGRKQLELETESWERFTEAVALVLRFA